MKVTVKIGTKEGFVSSLNLLFENGLRLKTEDITWMSGADKDDVQRQFTEVVAALQSAGWVVEQ